MLTKEATEMQPTVQYHLKAVGDQWEKSFGVEVNKEISSPYKNLFKVTLLKV